MDRSHAHKWSSFQIHRSLNCRVQRRERERGKKWQTWLLKISRTENVFLPYHRFNFGASEYCDRVENTTVGFGCAPHSERPRHREQVFFFIVIKGGFFETCETPAIQAKIQRKLPSQRQFFLKSLFAFMYCVPRIKVKTVLVIIESIACRAYFFTISSNRALFYVFNYLKCKCKCKYNVVWPADRWRRI